MKLLQLIVFQSFLCCLSPTAATEINFNQKSEVKKGSLKNLWAGHRKNKSKTKSKKQDLCKEKKEECIAISQLIREQLKAFQNKYKKCLDNNNPNSRASQVGNVQLLVWDNFGNVADIINEMSEIFLNDGTTNNNTVQETYVIGHDFGEHGQIPAIKRIARAIKKKKPNANVYSIDWSKLV